QLKVITICKKYKIPQYAIFDTSFYANLPKIASDYPIPREIVKKYNIKKYGFHGISHKSVTRGLRGKTISCHLGNGSSITASINGKAIDTSMGLTPVAGVIMATRSGDVDPGLVIYLQSKGYDMNKILNHKSGSLAYSQNTDIRDILKNFENPQVRAGYEIQIYSIIKYIGSYAAAMNGVDNIIFTAGIGQHIPKVREDICKSLEFLGVKLNKIKNKNNSDIISSNDSKVKLFVKDPNEEEMIAKEVFDKIHK
ncbi:MAG: acetate kinase, partial [Nanoarchaeota archaeon]